MARAEMIARCAILMGLACPVSAVGAEKATARFDYQGRAADAPWRKAAEARIEKHRKGDLAVTVLDGAGRPVADAQVTARMTRHAFGFGSAVAAEFLAARTADGQKYRETVRRLYNRVVFENDLKWPQWEDAARRKTTLDAIRWLEESNIEARGHCLVWPGWRRMPRDVQRLADDPPRLRKRVADHISEEVGALRGKLIGFDVINEPYSNHDLMDILGRKAMVEWFHLAHRADPALRLYINDYSILSRGGTDKAHQDHYEQTIRYLLDQGAPLQGIGLQSHFGAELTPPGRLIEILDRFAGFDLPLQITEHDINITDAKLQADYTRDFLTAVYSHPAVVGVLTWGFWEGRHWRPNAAYFRRDWSVTPAGEAWMDLVLKAWRTSAAGTTNDRGTWQTRGFLGDYEITVSRGAAKKTVKTTLVHDGTGVIVRLD